MMPNHPSPPLHHHHDHSTITNTNTNTNTKNKNTPSPPPNTTITTLLFHHPPPPHLQPKTQTRPFLTSLLGGGGNGNNSQKTRHLTATRTLPYPPAPLFRIISAVESYSSFLPFLTASTVTHRSPETGLPTRAFLTVGYGPLSETFTSRVDCDETKWVVEARSGAKFGVGKKDGQEGMEGFVDEGIFEYLSTRWELRDVSAGGKELTEVRLEIGFEFRSQLHAAMMGAVEGQMAPVMIEAFEKRIRDVLGER
ncbi:hypothetical protein BO70DRAFT_426128 [Aspergillus heteromorphus CBS 117.55]|uniref:Coenzyme Q-binding protein COQ10 START domain-containing protein n=1 Tax=Aspergillus heteromorphus CBS 117.55 TaxID=1448321 RepID=A0A317X0X0_9EURO|nr:uncharacterized protein BO70DRAFT_426128 [Aspergillus heteromorphus CBS 117.55]PWY91242.1 hypothetical protein BO70DRAFT_426128 [Aspergillus heteromorphus CBS 117.55]